jgi:hypothetical protein
MKKSLLILGIFALLLAACNTSNYYGPINSQIIQGSGKMISEERSVSGFDAVVLKGIGNLYITHGDTESLTIKADDNLLPYITTEVVDGKLEIGTKQNTNLNPSGTIVYTLTVKSLSAIILSGFGHIDADSLEGMDIKVMHSGSGDIDIDSVAGDTFDLDLTGFGNIKLATVAAPDTEINLTGSGDITFGELTASSLDLTLSGFGDATITGTAADQKVNLTGSGNYLAGDLASKTADLTISGFGDITAWVTDSIDITISGSGNLEYYGNPTVNTTLTGMGSIKGIGDK